jgi:hypothetical protein
MAVVDVDGIHAARDVARATIGRALRDELRATYERLTDTGPYSIDGAAIGRRSLRNTCLAYLAADGDADGIARAKAQFDAGQNMTDVLTALAVLSAIDCPERRAALAVFHASRQGEDLVPTSGSPSAMSPLPDTRMRCVRWQDTPTSICAIRTAYARWSPALLPAIRCASTMRPAADIASWPIPSSRWTRLTARSPRA